MERRVGLLETGDLFFALKDIAYSPETPTKDEAFTVKGKVTFLKIPFLGPCWIIATVTYPEKWWEEIIPIWGSPEVRATDIALGGDFEVTFSRGFSREGEFKLAVRVYPGPTVPLDSIVLPPAPAVATAETTFIVAGEAPPEEELFENFRIVSYSKNGGPPVSPPGVLELDVGDRCRINLAYNHKGPAVAGKFHAAIWQQTFIDPHDEILFKEQSFSVPSTTDWEPFENSLDIIITSAISPGSEYGLYCKMMGITGGDIFTEYLANVITIVGVPPEGEYKNLEITSYDSMSPPSVLTVRSGDTIRVTSEFDYIGPAVSGKIYSALWHASFYDPHDEIAHGQKSFSIPKSPSPGNHVTAQVSITVPAGFSGSDFGLYTKIIAVPGPDIFSPYYDNIVTIEEEVVPPTSDIKNFDFRATPGTYDLGDSVGYTAPYEYKGKAQGGWLTISLGTGVPPSFSTKYTYPRKRVSFDEAMDWTPGQLTGSFILPTTLELGQTYSVRAKLETDDGKQETDTDWGVLTIREVIVETKTLEIDITPVGSGYVTTDPAPLDIENHWEHNDRGKFEKGTRVRVTAHPHSGYTFDHWSDEIQGGVSYNNPEWVSDNGYMVDNKAVKAHFRTVPTGVTFKMSIWGIPDWGRYDKWMCYYWDPGTNQFAGDEKWYRPYDRIPFSNVQPGGYLAVFLLRNSDVSPQYTSPTFNAVDGGIYQYDLQLGRVTKIG